MRIKYVIHRGKVPFAHEKELFRKIIGFYADKYAGLRFIDRGLRFSAQYDDIDVDFDFGYQNMRYRDFSGYHHVIAESACSILDPELNPGDIIIPNSADVMRINNAATKVRVYTKATQYNNPMAAVYNEMAGYESSIDKDEVIAFATRAAGPKRKTSVEGLRSIKVKTGGCMVESNGFFRPSRFKDVDAVLRVGDDKLEIKDLQAHLEGRFEGVNCEAKQMIENVGSSLYMYAIGMDKPYAGTEQLPSDVRYGEAIEEATGTYDHSKVIYWQTLFFGYALSKAFRLNETKVAEVQAI